MAKQSFTVGQVLTASQMTNLQQTAMGGGSTTAKTASYTLVAADAGTVVQMNSATATIITVNTALFAAGDTVQIQNVGAGVCTVTAGTATVSTAGSLALSQYEGGQLYFNTTSAALFFDLVQASGGASALTFITGATFTTAATVSTAASTFTSTYDNYFITVDISASTNNTTFSLRLRAGGTDNTSANYYSAQIGNGIDGTQQYKNALSATSGNIFDITSSTDFTSMSFYVHSPQLSGRNTKCYGVASASSTGGTNGIRSGNVLLLVTSSFDAISFLCGAGTMTGQYRVYGLSNS